VKPLTKELHISFIPKILNIDFPEALGSELEKCKDDYALSALVVDRCIQQSKEIKAAGVYSSSSLL
jgi:methylenetetrahydrofolate reductase (NADPH)